MGLTLLTERHADQIAGVLSCYDRILVFGTLPGLCFAEGMTSFLYAHQVRIFDYARFAQPFRDELRDNAERLAWENGMEIEHLPKRNIRKEDLVKRSWRSEEGSRGWWPFFPPWSLVRATSPGITSKPVRPI